MESPEEPVSPEKSIGHATLSTDKEHAILEACRWRNLDALRVLAESQGGFITDKIRQQACECTPWAPTLSSPSIACAVHLPLP